MVKTAVVKPSISYACGTLSEFMRNFEYSKSDNFKEHSVLAQKLSFS